MTSAGTTRRLALLGIVLALALPALLMACGGNGDSGETTTAPPSSIGATPDAAGNPTSTAVSTAQEESKPAITDAAASVYHSLLGVIPDSPNARHLFIDDYDMVRRMFDVPLPGPGDDDDALEEFYSRRSPSRGSPVPVPTFGDVSFLGMWSQRGYMRSNLQYFALDIRNVNQTVIANPGLKEGLEEALTRIDVVRGSFDPLAADKALDACDGCVPHSREEHRGVTYYSWGEDYEWTTLDAYEPPAYDKRGIGGRIAVLDDYVFRTLGTPEMEALIDAIHNETPTLADVEEFVFWRTQCPSLGPTRCC